LVDVCGDRVVHGSEVALDEEAVVVRVEDRRFVVLTPATVGYPISLTEAIVLVAGVVCVLIANALVLRISFGGLGLRPTVRISASPA
jgi:hypothetical protein